MTYWKQQLITFVPMTNYYGTKNKKIDYVMGESFGPVGIHKVKHPNRLKIQYHSVVHLETGLEIMKAPKKIVEAKRIVETLIKKVGRNLKRETADKVLEGFPREVILWCRDVSLDSTTKKEK